MKKKKNVRKPTACWSWISGRFRTKTKGVSHLRTIVFLFFFFCFLRLHAKKKKVCARAAKEEEEKALQALESHSFLSTSENKYIFVSCARCCHRNFFFFFVFVWRQRRPQRCLIRRRQKEKKQGRKRPKWAAVIITRGDFYGKNCACQFLSKIDRRTSVAWINEKWSMGEKKIV